MSDLSPQEHTITLVDGTYLSKPCTTGKVSRHCLAFKLNGTLTTGTVTITARAIGGTPFEDIADGVVDLTELNTVLFEYPVGRYTFELSNVTGASGGSSLVITDIPMTTNAI